MSEIFLSRIAIHDFRTFGAFEIEIPSAPGLVLLTGTNGLGKSNFFDAIEWCLTNRIRRFEPYLQTGRKKLVEKDYLTRRGAEPGTHRVSLTYSGSDPIKRGAGTGTPMTEIIAKLARPDRRAINDLGTYLALTHFLGQAAQQRFTSRDPRDQWQTLKGPSGIEQLERIRAGLRGRSTIAAFTRRIETEQGFVSLLDRQIADWQGWMMRLQRLQSAARATGILTIAEVNERIDRLDADLIKLTSRQLAIVTGEDVGRRLTGLGDRIGDAVRAMSEQKSAMEALAPLPGEFAARRAEASADNPGLTRLRREVHDAQARIERAVPLVEGANNAVTGQNAAIAAIDQHITVLEAARTDMSRRAQLIDLIAADEKDRAALVDAIAAHRVAIESADRIINQHSEAVAEMARLRSLAASAKVLNDSMIEYLRLESDAGAAASALRLSRSAAEAASSQLGALETRSANLQSQIAEAEWERAEADRHATAISAALSQLASHVHYNDTNCPVCQSRFEPGVLKKLAEAAASSSDGRLATADEALEALLATDADLNARIADLRAQVATMDEQERAATMAANTRIDARAAIARVLDVAPDSDLVAIAAARVRDADAALAVANAALEPLVPSAAAASEQRSAASVDLDELITRESQLGARLSKFRAEDVACADRISARSLANVSLVDLDSRLTAQREQGEVARGQLAELTNRASAATATVQREQAALDTARRDLAAAELRRVDAEQSMRQIQLRWTQSGLTDEPSSSEYENRLAAIDTALVGLRSLAERQLVLARDNEDALLQSEIDEVIASMRVAGGNEGFSDSEKYLTDLKAKLAEARAAVKLTTSARSAVKRYSEDLQAQADDFSRRVLDPLNTVIDDFNEAMLSTPGESIQFKADTRVDATSFGMALRYREKVGNAIETKKDLPPQVVLSEGQLAANGFSILCAASTAYPWSRWRALLLDDPLQHNDIIHTAAFVDVMRNMVELNGYQLIMSSHDRGESDFIARKFDAAGLPCSTVLLTAPSDKGVVWAPPEQNQAATKILRQNVSLSRANSV